MTDIDTIAGYEILETLHVGRQTTLHRARQAGLAREVAIKVLSTELQPSERESALRGLMREAELLAALEHPSFPPLYAVAEWARGPVVVTRWLAGGSILSRFRAGGSLREAADLVARIGEGLDALHARGFVHGDLSARNIVFDARGLPHLIDLASAMPIGSRWTSERWPTTALTAAPELQRGKPVDGRADLYSLAVIAYFVVTGSWPFVGDETELVRARHASEPVSPPSSRCALLGLGPGVDEVLLRALAKQPEQRYASGAELASALAQVLVTSDERRATSDERPGLLGERRSASGPSEGAVVRAWKQLEAFADTLSPAQRAAFTALVGAIEREDADATATCGALIRSKVAPIAAMAAAERLGVYRALAEGPKTTHELALACGASSSAIARLCEYLRANDQLVAHEGGWRLRPPFAGAYGHGQRLGIPVRLVDDTLTMWSRLSDWARTGEGAFAMDADASGGDYVDGTAYLGDSCEAAAKQLAEQLAEQMAAPLAILDVGAGSAVWSLAMCAAWPRAHVTALDRPRVLEVALARAAAAGLGDRITAWAGSWLEVELPEATYDLIVLGNVCHLLSPAELSELFAWLRPALRAGGRIVILDVAPERLADAGEPTLRYDLALALRTARGCVHDRGGYEAALASVGLQVRGHGSLERASGPLDVLLADA